MNEISAYPNKLDIDNKSTFKVNPDLEQSQQNSLSDNSELKQSLSDSDQEKKQEDQNKSVKLTLELAKSLNVDLSGGVEAATLDDMETIEKSGDHLEIGVKNPNGENSRVKINKKDAMMLFVIADLVLNRGSNVMGIASELVGAQTRKFLVDFGFKIPEKYKGMFNDSLIDEMETKNLTDWLQKLSGEELYNFLNGCKPETVKALFNQQKFGGFNDSKHLVSAEIATEIKKKLYDWQARDLGI